MAVSRPAASALNVARHCSRVAMPTRDSCPFAFLRWMTLRSFSRCWTFGRPVRNRGFALVRQFHNILSYPNSSTCTCCLTVRSRRTAAPSLNSSVNGNARRRAPHRQSCPHGIRASHCGDNCFPGRFRYGVCPLTVTGYLLVAMHRAGYYWRLFVEALLQILKPMSVFTQGKGARRLLAQLLRTFRFACALPD
jgi:hypothetical protein